MSPSSNPGLPASPLIGAATYSAGGLNGYELQRVRDELVANKMKLSQWEDGIAQARSREAEESAKKAKKAEEEKLQAITQRDEVGTVGHHMGGGTVGHHMGGQWDTTWEVGTVGHHMGGGDSGTPHGRGTVGHHMGGGTVGHHMGGGTVGHHMGGGTVGHHMGGGTVGHHMGGQWDTTWEGDSGTPHGRGTVGHHMGGDSGTPHGRGDSGTPHGRGTVGHHMGGRGQWDTTWEGGQWDTTWEGRDSGTPHGRGTVGHHMGGSGTKHGGKWDTTWEGEGTVGHHMGGGGDSGTPHGGTVAQNMGGSGTPHGRERGQWDTTWEGEGTVGHQLGGGGDSGTPIGKGREGKGTALAQLAKLRQETERLHDGGFSVMPPNVVQTLESLPIMKQPLQTQLSSEIDPNDHATNTANMAHLAQMLCQSAAMKCMVCRDKNRSVAVAPCNHYVLCDACAAKTADCPYCHVHISQRSNIVLPL
ncbi:hypothetical protein NP493_453g03075 [Ridgeia piscesae]|uniref:RING-type domain-containing protein n=1 Tax=Ridgeia piscesae TaxID=27915 RepID=A0AAD9NRZ5_RIDPI|nr:hypothetical protein NP493_453g03075 [Ridgeia piscesae]